MIGTQAIMLALFLKGMVMLCQVFPQNYQNQLNEKQQRLIRLIPELNEHLTIFASPPSHYRYRAEFRVWHSAERIFYAMFDPAHPKQPVEITACPMACNAIDDLMQPLLVKISQNKTLKQGLFEIDFLASLSGEMLVTLIYRQKLDEQNWMAAAQSLKDDLAIDHLIGRSRKQKLVCQQDFIIERLQADNQAWLFQQVENSFTQPNAYMAQKMLGWAREQSRQIVSQQSSDLLELYCGNGHFSIALADIFTQVLATEISKTSVRSAQFNLHQNKIDNVKVVKMAAEDVTLALQGHVFNRMADVDLTGYNFKTIFVDPPRSGLDELTRTMATSHDNILYISCNPDSLAHDLGSLLQTHRIRAAALFDQFPYSHHIESGVWLQKEGAQS